MSNTIQKAVVAAIAVALVSGSFLFADVALAAPELVRSTLANTIYYIDGNNVRHPFPTLATYQSWYGADFSRVVTISPELLATFPLGKNITVRPGTKLVKIPSAPEVYAVEQGGVLREIKDESIASAIYGSVWARRVVDVPEVFFSDYTIGAPIVHDYTIPDSILYQDKDSQKYYFKNNGILRQFASPQAIAENGFTLADAITGSRSYAIRTRSITARDKNVFNPVAFSWADRRDCANTGLKAAFIFVADDTFTPVQINTVQTIKTDVPDYYNWATSQLSSIDVSYPTSVYTDDGYLLKARNDGTHEINSELLQTFYDTNQDIFDFIFVFTNFEIPKQSPNEIAYFVPVTNKVEGIGRGNLDRSEVYGSAGKLKGIIIMGNVAQYDVSEQSGLNQALNVIGHEILHNWAAYIGFTDETGEVSYDLLRHDDRAHWSIYDNFISPLGGSGWVDNNDGTFTSGLLSLPEATLRQYSSLDLYLMGLIPAQLMADVSYTVPTEANAIGNTIAGTTRTVTIEQIIQANGPIACSLD